jgi:hypothetical protein
MTEIEKAALGHGIILLMEKAKLGASSRLGFGSVGISSEKAPSNEEYVRFMNDHKQDILDLLLEVGALNA